MVRFFYVIPFLIDNVTLLQHKLPEGQELELEFKVLLSDTTELSKEQKKDLIKKMQGSMKGTWGSTVEEIDAYLASEREA